MHLQLRKLTPRPYPSRRSNTVEWVQEGRAASTEDVDKLMKEVYVMMCSSSNNADPNAKDRERDVSLEVRRRVCWISTYTANSSYVGSPS